MLPPSRYVGLRETTEREAVVSQIVIRGRRLLSPSRCCGQNIWVFLLAFIWALQGQLRAVKLHAKTDRLPRTLIQSTLESIRFVTRVRLETEQQNGQGANDYDRSHGYSQILLICQLHCHGPSVGFDTPSFEAILGNFDRRSGGQIVVAARTIIVISLVRLPRAAVRAAPSRS